jgi:hypothetical protein
MFVTTEPLNTYSSAGDQYISVLSGRICPRLSIHVTQVETTSNYRAGCRLSVSIARSEDLQPLPISELRKGIVKTRHGLSDQWITVHPAPKHYTCPIEAVSTNKTTSSFGQSVMFDLRGVPDQSGLGVLFGIDIVWAWLVFHRRRRYRLFFPLSSSEILFGAAIHRVRITPEIAVTFTLNRPDPDSAEIREIPILEEFKTNFKIPKILFKSFKFDDKIENCLLWDNWIAVHSRGQVAVHELNNSKLINLIKTPDNFVFNNFSNFEISLFHPSGTIRVYSLLLQGDFDRPVLVDKFREFSIESGISGVKSKYEFYSKNLKLIKLNEKLEIISETGPIPVHPDPPRRDMSPNREFYVTVSGIYRVDSNEKVADVPVEGESVEWDPEYNVIKVYNNYEIILLIPIGNENINLFLSKWESRGNSEIKRKILEKILTQNGHERRSSLRQSVTL